MLNVALLQCIYCQTNICFLVSVTGEKLKCIVIVKAITKIEIQTTTRALYLEDSPEELNIQGYDDAGKIILIFFLYACH